MKKILIALVLLVSSCGVSTYHYPTPTPIVIKTPVELVPCGHMVLGNTPSTPLPC